MSTLFNGLQKPMTSQHQHKITQERPKRSCLCLIAEARRQHTQDSCEEAARAQQHAERYQRGAPQRTTGNPQRPPPFSRPPSPS
jgi:hypothetical protein